MPKLRMGNAMSKEWHLGPITAFSKLSVKELHWGEVLSLKIFEVPARPTQGMPETPGKPDCAAQGNSIFEAFFTAV